MKSILLKGEIEFKITASTPENPAPSSILRGIIFLTVRFHVSDV